MEQLRRLREARNMTQAALAFAAGVTPQAISQWETGESSPSMGRLARLADALGATVGQVIGTEPLDADSAA